MIRYLTPERSSNKQELAHELAKELIAIKRREYLGSLSATEQDMVLSYGHKRKDATLSLIQGGQQPEGASLPSTASTKPAAKEGEEENTKEEETLTDLESEYWQDAAKGILPLPGLLTFFPHNLYNLFTIDLNAPLTPDQKVKVISALKARNARVTYDEDGTPIATPKRPYSGSSFEGAPCADTP